MRLENMKELAYLLEVAEICKEELRVINIDFNESVEFKVNTRAKKRFGLCTYKNNLDCDFEIQITDRLLKNSSAIIGLKNTIIHELLHTVEGCMNHGKKWKSLADEVNRAYGYNIKRASSCAEKGIESEIVPKKVNYMFKCKDCGQVIKRTRMSKFVKYYTYYRCGGCNGHFERTL